jgi:photosystem II stability/assembly factor-like uncharacterized protein
VKNKCILPLIILVFLLLNTSCDLSSPLVNGEITTGVETSREVVVVSNIGEIVTSADGQNWKSYNNEKIDSCKETIRVRKRKQNSDESTDLSDNIMVSVTYTDAYYSEDNGLTWTHAKQITDGVGDLYYTDGVFFIIGGGTGFIERSEDGKNWERVLSGGSFLSSIAAGPDNIVVTGMGDRIITSFDSGKTWNNDNSGNGTQVRFNSVIYAEDKYLAVGTAINGINARWATSTDGVYWSNTTVDADYQSMNDVAYGNGFFITGGYRYILASEDGIEWVEVHNPSAQINGIEYINGTFIASGRIIANGCPFIATSRDNGVTWNEIAIDEYTQNPVDSMNVDYIKNDERFFTSISGKLVDEESNPIVNALVVGYDIDISSFETTYTDAQGAYSLQIEHNTDFEITIVVDSFENRQLSIETENTTVIIDEIILSSE